MEGQKLWRLGGACAMLAGVLYLAVLPISVVPLLATGESPTALFEAAPFYALIDRIPLPFLLGGLGLGHPRYRPVGPHRLDLRVRRPGDPCHDRGALSAHRPDV